MEKENIKQNLKAIIISVLKHDSFNMTDEMSASDVEGWDSLTHMMIITEIESKFGIRFKLKELNSLNNIGNLIELINTKLLS